MSAIAAARARSQHLVERLRNPTELVRRLGGVQAQEPGAAALSIRARTEGPTIADVERALVGERSLVRMWAMRGTLHLVASEDAGWLQALYEPLLMAGQRRALRKLDVPERDWPRAVDAIRAALAEHGPLTRAALMEHVERAGIATGGQRAAHLPRLAAIQGHVCFGPTAGSKPTYALRSDWLGPRAATSARPREEAIAELARRYAHAYAPTTPHDFASWSGLSLGDARAGWEAIARELTETPAGWMPSERVAWLDEPTPAPPVVRMLPAFDTYLLGYRTRDEAVPAEHAARVWPGGGIVRPTVIENGRAVATWRQTRRGRRVAIEVEPFGDAPDTRDEFADIGRFLGAEPV